MGVHRTSGRLAEEGDGRADHALVFALAVEEADDVVARLLQGAQGSGIHHALRTPDGVEQALGVEDEFNGVEITDGSHAPSLPLLGPFEESGTRIRR